MINLKTDTVYHIEMICNNSKQTAIPEDNHV